MWPNSQCLLECSCGQRKLNLVQLWFWGVTQWEPGFLSFAGSLAPVIPTQRLVRARGCQTWLTGTKKGGRLALGDLEGPQPADDKIACALGTFAVCGGSCL